MPKVISRQALNEMLDEESLGEEALLEYFEPYRANAFTYGYRLRPDVEVVSADGEPELEEAGWALDTANFIMRRGRRKKYARMIRADASRPRFVSEGDSWFQHPLVSETVDHLMDGHGHPIFSLDAAGDTLADIVSQDKYLQALDESGAVALLLSGGGNDLMGGHFGDFLNDWTVDDGEGPGRLLNGTFDIALNQVFSRYRGLFRRIQDERPQVKMFVHCYDYVQPGTGRAGRWLGEPMRRRGITDPSEKRFLMREIIDRFHAGLSELCKQFAGQSYLVDTRNTVGSGQWYDEIHANSSGYAVVAFQWQSALKAAGIV